MNECKIVQDLLPLYAEELVSPETREFMDAHCESCEECGKLRSRAMEPMPEAPIDTKAYQKLLRRDSFKMMVRGVGIVMMLCLIFVLLVGGGTVYAAWEMGYWPLENSYESVVIHEEYGKITNEVKIADWDHAGFFDNGAGSMFIHSNTVRKGNGTQSSSGRGARDWENVQLYWAPNGLDYLLEVDIAGGERGYFIVDNDYWLDEKGRTDSGMDWYPASDGRGMTEKIRSLCENEDGFAIGWSEITFTFYQWGEDSETVTFIYETDNGYRGLLDFHYPSETITDFT